MNIWEALHAARSRRLGRRTAGRSRPASPQYRVSRTVSFRGSERAPWRRGGNLAALAIVVLGIVTFGVQASASKASAATRPTPSYGTADVNGDYSEWNLTNDIDSQMWVGGDSSKQNLSTGYLRYDCSTQTIYVLVLQAGIGTDNAVPLMSSATGNAWADIDGSHHKVYDDNSPGSTFTWIGRGYSSANSTYAQGYEASFSLTPNVSHTVLVHVEALYNGSGNTSAWSAPAGAGIAVDPVCGGNSSTTATTVFDASTNAQWSGTEGSGTSAYDTATVTGSAGTPTGNVTYSFFSNGTCTDTATSTDIVNLSSGTVPHSTSTGSLSTGSYSFRASYSGDPTYKTSTGSCEPFSVVSNENPSIATTPLPTTGTVSVTSYSDSATLTEDEETTNGETVTFRLFGPFSGTITPQSCVAGSLVTTETGTLSSGKASAAGVTVSSAGTYQWVASYAGDSENSSAGTYQSVASYAGDSENSSAAGVCGDTSEQFSATKATSQTATVVYDATLNLPWTGLELTGASAYDTSTVIGSAGTPSGTVTYNFFHNGTCSVTPASTSTVTLNANGSVPNSSSTGGLATGNYSFQASYSGNGTYNASTGSCEPFSLGRALSLTATVVDDAATSLPWTRTEATSAAAYDTATVSGVGLFTPTGTVTYNLFHNGTCSGSPATASTVTLNANGSVPNSSSTGGLGAGSYSFQASYSGDSNYGASTGACEPFSLVKASSLTATVVDDASTSLPWTGTEMAGASAYDTASVAGMGLVTPSGTVTYNFFHNGTCSGTPATASTVTLNANGSVPNSSSSGALNTAGSYSFQASSSGDSNYASSTGSCEPFSVLKNTSQTATVVFDAATNAQWAGTETSGASAYDTSTVTGSAGTPSGTVTYDFFNNNGCTGTPASGMTVTLNADGSVPNSSTAGPLSVGSYSFQANYSGNGTYNSSTGSCEPFSVGKASPSLSTTPSPTTGTVSVTSYSDTATLSGTAGSTDGESVTFKLYGPFSGTIGAQSCVANNLVTTETASLSGGSATAAGTTVTAAGTYQWVAGYPGDSQNSPVAGVCGTAGEQFSASKNTSQTATVVFDAATNAQWAGTETSGASTYDTSTVTGSAGTPSGTVTYNFFNNNGCTGTPGSGSTVSLNANGTVPNSSATGALTVGSYSFQANYSGNGTYNSSTGSCEPFSVGKASPSIATTPSPTTGTVSVTSYSDTATLTGLAGSTNGESVSFSLYGPFTGTIGAQSCAANNLVTTETASLSGGSATAAGTTVTAAGTYQWVASYPGDSENSPVAGVCGTAGEQFSASKNNPSIITTPSQSSVTLGSSSVTLGDTAVLSGGYNPTGTITFTLHLGSTLVDTETVTVNGDGSYSTPTGYTVPSTGTVTGTYQWDSSYSGDSNNNSASENNAANEQVTVSPATPNISTTASPTSGTVTVTNYGDTATLSGTAGSTDGESITFKLYGPFTGTIGAQSCTADNLVTTATSTLSGGSATASGVTVSLPGTYQWVASYLGDSQNSSTSGACGDQTEQFSASKNTSQTATVVFDASTNAQWAGTETSGASAYDTSTVTGSAGTPSGTVNYNFYKNGTCNGTPFSGSTVTLNANGSVPNSSATGALTTGSYSFQAVYSGNGTYNDSTGSCEPFSVGAGVGLQVTTTATPAYTRTYSWNVRKLVNSSKVTTAGSTANFRYTVEALETGFADGGWKATGTISVVNPSRFEALTAAVTDAVNNGGVCTVQNGSSVVVAAGATVQLSYTCTYAAKPNPASGIDTATARWAEPGFTSPLAASGTAHVSFTAPTTLVHRTMTPTDAFAGSRPVSLCSLQARTPCQLTATDSPPLTSATYTYTKTVPVIPGRCVQYQNVAATGLGQTSRTVVATCGLVTFKLYLGYTDGIRKSPGTTPGSPWEGSPDTTFIGCPNDTCPNGKSKYDGGAILLVNNSPNAIVLDSGSVTIGHCVFRPWSSNLKIPGAASGVPGSFILTETGSTTVPQGHQPGCSGVPAPTLGDNFDTSDTNPLPCAKQGTGDGVIPLITLDVAGTTRIFRDTAQVLNTKGGDPGCHAKGETHPWTSLASWVLPPSASPANGAVLLRSVNAAGVRDRIDHDSSLGGPVGAVMRALSTIGGRLDVLLGREALARTRLFLAV